MNSNASQFICLLTAVCGKKGNKHFPVLTIRLVCKADTHHTSLKSVSSLIMAFVIFFNCLLLPSLSSIYFFKKMTLIRRV